MAVGLRRQPHPVFTIIRHAPDGSGAKVLVTGLLDGSFVGRLVLEDEAGILTVDKGRRYRPRTTPTTSGTP